MNKFCKEHDFEACAMNLCLISNKFCIISVYRSPPGSFPYLISTLDSVLNKLYSLSSNLILCGDININYLCNSTNKFQSDSLLASYSLFNIVDFPTRIDSKSSTAIDGIFIDKFKFDNYSISPVVKGLSDHDAQSLILNNIKTQSLNSCRFVKRQINTVNIENVEV
jgi:hypothetical protein